MTAAVWIPPLAAVASWALTGVVRGYARRRLLDMPNARSSHATPTPRGGGLAIVATFVAGVVTAWVLGAVPARIGAALAVPGVGVAAVGFLDDHGHVPARWRLAAHAVAAAVGLYAIGGVPPLRVGAAVVDLGWAGHLLGVAGVVWLLNLYNFMDGIDGLAAAEAVTAGLAGAVCAAVVLPGSGAWVTPAVLAGAAAGFLVWNAPPARIFLGDVGSGFLGFALGLLALVAARREPTLLWAWMILLGVFVVDATMTLVRRAARGERVYEAHRSHAYQHAARRLGAHAPVSAAVAAVNVLWLAPLALAVATRRLDGVLGVAVAYAPLAWAALRWDAGADERRPAQSPGPPGGRL